MRFLPAGEQAMLVEMDDLPQVLALHARLTAAPPPGLCEMIPAARTLFLRFDPALIDAAGLARAVLDADTAPVPKRAGRRVAIPVCYDGPDLDEVAALTGMSRDEVIARHSGTPWRAAFGGFAPGFCYLTGGDPALDVLRRSTPRRAVPVGSVGLAGAFSGVYPQASPGGWQLIGRTSLPMWDLTRDPPAAVQPGDEVEFVPCETLPEPPPPPARQAQPQGRGLLVLAAGLPALFQDLGRPGLAAQGIGRSGAADRAALREANRLVGNPPGSPAIEITAPLHLRAECAAVLAVSEAARLLLNDRTALPAGQAFALDPGDELRITPESGVYAYLAARRGFDVAPVLGSAARDTLAGIGPAPLVAGDRVGLGAGHADAVGLASLAPAPIPSGVIEVPVTLGPRADWFDAETLARFLAQGWQVSPRISRIGTQLSGEPLTRRDQSELASEATPRGAIQIPHSGLPVLFLADHPVTGGYPVIAVIADAALDRVAQAAPGTTLRFHARSGFAPITPSPRSPAR